MASLLNKRNNIETELEKTSCKKLKQSPLKIETQIEQGLSQTASQASSHEAPLQEKVLTDAEILFGTNILEELGQESSARTQKSQRSRTVSKSTSPFNLKDLPLETINEEELEHMVLRSGLELSKSSSKDNQEEYEHLKHLQYHPSSGKSSTKKKSSRKGSQGVSPVGGESSVQDYFQEASNFIINEEGGKGSVDNSMMSVQRMFDKKDFDLAGDFQDLKKPSVEFQLHETMDDSNMASIDNKKIKQLLHCILVEGEVLWEVEWNDKAKEEGVTFEYEKVLESEFSEEFKNMKNQYIQAQH